MIKRILKIYIPVIAVLFVLFMVFFASPVKAEDCNPQTGRTSAGKICYVFLETNPLVDPNSTVAETGYNIADFLGGVFRFGIAAAVALALIMIIWGGIEYMTADAWFNKQDGTKKIQDALIGLGIALISYLVLYTINPCFVDFKIGPKDPTATYGCGSMNTFLGNKLPQVTIKVSDTKQGQMSSSGQPTETINSVTLTYLGECNWQALKGTESKKYNSIELMGKTLYKPWVILSNKDLIWAQAKIYDQAHSSKVTTCYPN